MLKKCLLSISALALIGGGIIAAAPPSAAIGGVSDGASRSRGKDQPADLFGDAGIFTRVSNIMLFLVGAIAVIMIIFGGIRYVVSGAGCQEYDYVCPRWCRGGTAGLRRGELCYQHHHPWWQYQYHDQQQQHWCFNHLASNTWLSSHTNICAHHRGVRFSLLLTEFAKNRNKASTLFFVIKNLQASSACRLPVSEIWRRERDSNPRSLAAYRFSRAASSTTPAPLHVVCSHYNRCDAERKYRAADILELLPHLRVY